MEHSYGGIPQARPSYDTDSQCSRPTDRTRRVRRPPRPCVEDEVESLAREHTPSIAPSLSDEEPKNRGEVDQYPILVPVEVEPELVSEQNSERRFVLVNSDLGTEEVHDTPSHSPARSPTKSEYEDNTCRQYVLLSSDEPRKEEVEEKLSLGKKKSYQDLPRLNTDVGQDDPIPPEPSIKRSVSRRNREKPIIDQPPRGSAQESIRLTAEAVFSPIVTHMAGGRERAYLDINSGAAKSPSAKGPREEPRSKRNEEKRSTHSSSPSVRRRMSSTAGPRPSGNALGAFGYGNADDIYAFMMPGGEAPSRRERMSESPTKSRTSVSPPYPPTSRDRQERPAGQRVRRQSDARERLEYYGSSALKNTGSSRSERPRPRRETDTLLSPEKARSGPKGPSPLPSPHVAQGTPFPEISMMPSPHSPRSSTLPYLVDRRRTDEYSVAPPTISGSPPRKPDDADRILRPNAPSRTAAIPSGGMAMPIPIPLGRPSDRRPPAATGLEEPQDPGSQSQPGQLSQFDPEKHNVYLDRPVTSYRRFSEDVQHGVLPQLPECCWVNPTIPSSRGDSSQFLTLPGASNFTICSECYGAVFADTSDFGHVFVRAPARPLDQAISCDFGSHPWYRIAWLMTLKYRYRDLRLLEMVATVAARNQPCPGERPANRIWYSMLDPGAGRPVNTFSICPTCTKLVGALFPSLADIFFPLDPYPAPRKGICDLHFAPERKRFLEYFDLMETISDRARNRRGLPDIQELADRVRDLSLLEECPRDSVVQNRKW